MEHRTMARTTSSRGELVLQRRGDGALELRVNGVFVMDTAHTKSEQALARAVLEAGPAPRRVLVGGLGLGFTVATLLADPRVEQVLVAEIEPVVVAWLRDGTVPHGPALLGDDRVDVRIGDVRDVLADCGRESLDAVLLDVDNGPDHLVHAGNASLYREPFLTSCLDRLRPGGLLGIWSSTRSAPLERALTSAAGGYTVRAHGVDLAGRAEEYALYLAVR